MRYQFISATALTDEPLFLGTSTDWGFQTVEEQHQDGRQVVVTQARPWVLWLPRGTSNSNEPNFDEATNDEHQLRYTWDVWMCCSYTFVYHRCESAFERWMTFYRAAIRLSTKGLRKCSTQMTTDEVRYGCCKWNSYAIVSIDVTAASY